MESQTPLQAVRENERSPSGSMKITKEQAKYWYSVAKKDVQEGNLDGARNVHRWLVENKAWYHAKFLGYLLKNTSR